MPNPGFRFNLLALLKKFRGQDQVSRLIPEIVKIDLQIWAKGIQASGTGFPIPEMRIGPPLSCLYFVSDAAGAAYRWEGGEKLNISTPGDRGAESRLSVSVRGGGFCGRFALARQSDLFSKRLEGN